MKESDVAEAYAQRLEAALPEEDLSRIFFEDYWNRTKVAITSVAESVVGYAEPGKRNDWFVGECQAVLVRTDTARRQMLLHGTQRGTIQAKMEAASLKRGYGAVIPFSRKSQVLQETQRFP